MNWQRYQQSHQMIIQSLQRRRGRESSVRGFTLLISRMSWKNDSSTFRLVLADVSKNGIPQPAAWVRPCSIETFRCSSGRSALFPMRTIENSSPPRLILKRSLEAYSVDSKEWRESMAYTPKMYADHSPLPPIPSMSRWATISSMTTWMR